MSKIIGLLPSAGTASRLFNIPKFMLPMRDKNISLMSGWIDILDKQNCEKIIIGASPDTIHFVDHLVKTQQKNLIHKIIIKNIGNTETMTETIIKCLEGETYDLTIMCMPDTNVEKISSSFLQELLNTDDIYAGVYLWNIRDTQVGKIGQCNINDEANIIIDMKDKDLDCKYKYGWGIAAFKPNFEKYLLNDDLHIGYSMARFVDNNNKLSCKVMNGMYFDCGTVQGYREYLNYKLDQKPIHIKGTIIILAVYINNDLVNYNHLIDSLTQLRKIYKYETIVAVDNGSLNKKWFELAETLDINVLENDSVLHKYEMGAYRYALQYYRADNYIFLQGTIFIKKQLDLSLLDCDSSVAIPLSILNGLHWSQNGLNMINKLLKAIDMDEWNNDPIVLWNCFCANNLFITNMVNDGMFDLPSNTKDHSCSFERILGCYLVRKQNKLHVLDDDAFVKIGLNQYPYPSQ